MKQTELLWDMPITLEILDASVSKKDFDEIFSYFRTIDDTFSSYKKTSEISRINHGDLVRSNWSRDMETIFSLAEKTTKETNGYFSILHNGMYDLSGIVKGWAILQASDMLKKKGLKNFYVDAGGDIQVSGKNSDGKPWRIGIRNPFNRQENVKILSIVDHGVATSGTYIRGQHIYDPFHPKKQITDIVSLTVIGPDVFEADRFATPAFAMGKKGIQFIEKLEGFEGYMIDSGGVATYTSGFQSYVYKDTAIN